MNKILDLKYPYISNFFKAAIENNRLFHSLIFTGSNNLIQYALALEIARQLNCLEDKSENCNCLNCRWIRENKHPAIMTISKIDNKTDSSKTVISEEQINQVLDTLVISSDYHRVYIFCDAQIKQLSTDEEQKYNEFISTGYTPPTITDGDEKWFPSGINSDCFTAVAANSMLKSIEEPPNNVTFIFLTNNKDDLIQTIVSRSQVYHFADFSTISYNTSFLKNYFDNYPRFDKNKCLDFVQDLLSYQITNNLEPIYIIDSIQFYLGELAKLNTTNSLLLKKIFKDIKKLQTSKSMINSYIKEQTVYEDLAFYFAK